VPPDAGALELHDARSDRVKHFSNLPVLALADRDGYHGGLVVGMVEDFQVVPLGERLGDALLSNVDPAPERFQGFLGVVPHDQGLVGLADDGGFRCRCRGIRGSISVVAFVFLRFGIGIGHVVHQSPVVGQEKQTRGVGIESSNGVQLGTDARCCFEGNGWILAVLWVLYGYFRQKSPHALNIVVHGSSSVLGFVRRNEVCGFVVKNDNCFFGDSL